ncbi:MAG: BlaI/MecI/CopY family transcriptional regulator [Planctomycetaceae bacterium]|nr:BlaI/MecI/CopY family transcriptional regulator [Planctomycetaceae bacterium]
MANITEAEWPIMEVLWTKGTATSGEIIAVVIADRDISGATVKSLINRLVKKEMITYTIDRHDSRVYHYSPLLSRDEATKRKNDTLLGTVYQSDPMNMLTRFVKDASLSRKDIDDLYAILREKEKEARARDAESE